MLQYFKRKTHNDMAKEYLAESQRLALDYARQAEYCAAQAQFHRAQVETLSAQVGRKEPIDVHQ